MKKLYFLYILFNVIFFLASCDSQKSTSVENTNNLVVMETYQDIMKGDKGFYFYTNFNNGSSDDVKEFGYQGKDTFLSDLLDNYSDDELVWKIENFAVVDMDMDGVPELITELSFIGELIVFHYESGDVFASSFSHRGLSHLKKDGTFISSGGAAYTQFNRLQFVDGVCTNVVLAYSDTVDVDEQKNIQGVYFINNEEVSWSMFDAFWNEHDKKEDVNWYSYFEETIVENLALAWDNL